MSDKLHEETSLEQFWAGQRAVVFLALISGVSFWVALSFVKGLIFALFMIFLMEPFIFYGLWRSRRLKLKVGSHELTHRGEIAGSEDRRATVVSVRIAQKNILFPPVDDEFLWAEEQEEPGLCKVINIPYFAPGISYGDTIAASERNGRTYFDEIVSFSNHSRLGIVIRKHKLIGKISGQLEQLGCSTEHNYIKGVVSVDVPGEIDYLPIFELLSGYRDEKKIIFEEPVLRHEKN
jgi:Domain of unknown function (DUF4265)